MKERELFIQSIPLIAEITVESRKISDVEYEEWKHETLNNAPDTAKDFILKVLSIIDKYRQNGFT